MTGAIGGFWNKSSARDRRAITLLLLFGGGLLLWKAVWIPLGAFVEEARQSYQIETARSRLIDRYEATRSGQNAGAAKRLEKTALLQALSEDAAKENLIVHITADQGGIVATSDKVALSDAANWVNKSLTHYQIGLQQLVMERADEPGSVKLTVAFSAPGL